MRNRITAVAAIAAASALVLGGCTAAEDTGEDAFHIAVFTPGYGAPVGKYAMDLFIEAGRDLGWEVDLYTSDFDYDKLNNDVSAAIRQGVDAVMGGWPDPRQIGPIITAAEEAGIPIFAFDSGVESTPALAIDVTTSQQQVTDLTVGALEEAMGGLEGKEVMIIGFDPHLGIGFRGRLAEAQLIEAGAVIAGGDVRQIANPATAQEEALKIVTDYLQANPDGLDGVWTAWDQVGLGATLAINEAGRDDIFVTGVDGVSGALDAIKANGPFYATISQDWQAIVQLVVDAVTIYAENGDLPESNFVTTEVTLVTRENVDNIEPTD
ncbi:sugar ABC transporter substrate-binding protein [Pseudolysinimonas sp.]|uniref:sugar ABC transporter substrate-binding protein n=1 Tax=Pseudolysinimonas sp. TaxID=2680009 RepID=UPI00286C2353|nr:sugar ABC transporter substrate-binding protein [Pseudolysinimonas sp.]